MYSERQLLLKWLQEYTTLLEEDLEDMIDEIKLTEEYEVSHYGNYEQFVKEAIIMQAKSAPYLIEGERYNLYQNSKLLYTFSDDERIGFNLAKTKEQIQYEPFFEPDCESVVIIRYDCVFTKGENNVVTAEKAVNFIFHYLPGIDESHTDNKYIQALEIICKIAKRFPTCKADILSEKRPIISISIDGDELGFEYYKGNQFHLFSKSDNTIEKYLAFFEEIIGSDYLYRRYRPEKKLWYYRWYELDAEMQRDYEDDYRRVEMYLEKEWESL